MFLSRFSFVLGLLLSAGACPAAETVFTNLSDLVARDATDARTPFQLQGTILYGDRSPAIYIDGQIVKLTALRLGMFSELRSGDRITVKGYRKERTFNVHTIENLGRVPLPTPDDVTARDLLPDRCNYRLVRVQGTVTDIFRDDIDAGFLYFVLESDGTQFYASISYRLAPAEWAQQLIGSTVRLTGVCTSSEGFQRPFMGCIVRCLDANAVEITNSSVTTPLDHPKLEVPSSASPQAIAGMGKRRIRGTVLAVCSDNVLIVRSDGGCLHRIALADNQPLPAVRDVVVVGGTVQTDFYLINLTHAICSVVGRSDEPPETAVDASADDILFNRRHEKQAMPRFYGQAIRLKGTVMKPHVSLRSYDCLYLDCGSAIVPIDVFGTGQKPADFPVGSVVSASGICLMDVENWSPTNPFAKIRGFSLVTRTKDDIRLLASPPWWTPVRIITVVGILLALLVGIGAWNLMLNRLIRRRTLELVRARIARDRSDLKADERTRLAVELHDSLSQNLSGLGCQLIATRQALREDASDAERRLATAETMLTSTRAELKRCLFDLRNDALEETDFEEAIRQTLVPVVGAAKIILRFVVPRSQMDDSQAHAILSIVRELTANAVYHGKAGTVRIAGCLDEGKVVFSVRDDGSGFDPARCDGPLQGHFGLSGIRTRVKKMSGTFAIDSQPGKGTHVKVTLLI